MNFIQNFTDTKAREQELAMWKRRATYDPMKAAAEGRKKQEEAKKSTNSSKFADRYVFNQLHSFTIQVLRLRILRFLKSQNQILCSNQLIPFILIFITAKKKKNEVEQDEADLLN